MEVGKQWNKGPEKLWDLCPWRCSICKGPGQSCEQADVTVPPLRRRLH